MKKTARRRLGVLLAVALAFAWSPVARAGSGDGLPAWFVQVNHRIDLEKFLEVARGDMPDVDMRSQTLRRVTNLTAGVLVDTDGHVVTRLVNYDPRVSDLELSVTSNDGKRLEATLVGLDAPSGFVVLQVPGLRGTSPAPADRVPALKPADELQILRRDYAPPPVHTPQTLKGGVRRPTVLPKLPPMRGNVDSVTVPPVLARGGVVSTVKSPAFISSGDLSLVASATGQVLGVARYEMRGVGQLVPISYLKDVVARRVLAARGSVESGWLGADGSWIADLPEPGRPKSATTGVVVSHLVEGGPALRAGLAVNDVIVSFDGVPVGSLVDLGTLVRSTPAGSSVPIAFVRDGKSMTVDAELGRRPASGAMRLAPTSPDFGLSVLDLNAQLAEFLGVSNGVFVQFVREGTPAGNAGLRAGDVITMVGDTPIANRLAFNSALVDAPSSTVKLAVHREKATIFLTISLAAPK